MKLNEITHDENGVRYRFNIECNRFVVFDRNGYEINIYYLEDQPNYGDFKVIAITKSSYSGYGVGFPTTQIMIDYDPGDQWINKEFSFGDADTRG